MPASPVFTESRAAADHSSAPTLTRIRHHTNTRYRVKARNKSFVTTGCQAQGTDFSSSFLSQTRPNWTEPCNQVQRSTTLSGWFSLVGTMQSRWFMLVLSICLLINQLACGSTLLTTEDPSTTNTSETSEKETLVQPQAFRTLRACCQHEHLPGTMPRHNKITKQCARQRTPFVLFSNRNPLVLRC